MYKIVVLPGDGIGVEVIDAALNVLEAAGRKTGLEFDCNRQLIGGASIDVHGIPVTDKVLSLCKEADAVLLGAIGGPKWDNVPFENRPEAALFRLRKELGVFTNLRPVKLYDKLLTSSPLKPEILRNVDLLIVRELTGGLYFGKPKEIKSVGNEEIAVDTMEYRTSEIERIAVAAFDAAMSRGKKVMSVDKANVLATSRLWRRTVERIAGKYPEVSLDHMLVDNCAMQLIRYPGQFDVILTENTFGDILSDEASMLTGSLGMLPSASLGENTGVYEPVHGSAPDIAGKNIANPVAAITSAAMMLRYSLKSDEAASLIENAVEEVLNEGFMTVDILLKGCTRTTTAEFSEKVVGKILQ